MLIEYWASLRAMQGAGLYPNLLGIQWFQGEQDATVEAWANAYATNLTEFINSLKLWSGFNSPLFHVIRLADEGDGVYLATVRAAQESVAANLPKTTLVDSDGYSMLDAVHLDSVGQIALGIDMANI